MNMQINPNIEVARVYPAIDPSDNAILNSYFDHAHHCLMGNDAVKSRLAERCGQLSEWVLFTHRIGFVDRSYARLLPDRDSYEGGSIRGVLQRLGISNPRTGHEAFRGMIIVPITDLDGRTIGAWGQRDRTPCGSPITHVTQWDNGLPIFNAATITLGRPLVLANDPLEAVSLMQKGVTNVIALTGLYLPLDPFLHLLRRYRITRIDIWPRWADPATASLRAIATELSDEGIDVRQWMPNSRVEPESFLANAKEDDIRYLIDAAMMFDRSMQRVH